MKSPHLTTRDPHSSLSSETSDLPPSAAPDAGAPQERAGTTTEKEFPIQNVGTIPWSLAERAYADYAARYGTSQPIERMAERGGFSLAELGDHLSGLCSRLDSPREISRCCEFATKAILAARRAQPETATKEIAGRWVWQCGDCNAWIINEGRGKFECGHCGVIKPMAQTLVMYHWPLPTTVIADPKLAPAAHQETPEHD